MKPRPFWSPPAAFDEYELLRALGRGAMGQVYLARDALLDRPVAVKFIAAAAAPGARERFIVEARALARLQHPNVVTVHRVGEIDGHPYLVSEYVVGRRLDRIERPVEWLRVLEIGIGMARGLAAAHRSGVLHRDIKPQNTILAEGGEAKLLDFGLAKLSGAAPVVTRQAAEVAGLEVSGAMTLDLGGRREVRLVRPAAGFEEETTADRGGDFAAGEASTASGSRPEVEATDPASQSGRASPSALSASAGRVASSPSLTQDGDLVGTPLYMAPELWCGEPATTRSDVYAVGAVLYELLAGRTPHEPAATAELAFRVIDTDPAPVAERAPAADARLCRIVERCLARDPALRYSDGGELREALEALMTAERGGRVPAGNPYRGLRPFDADHRALFFGRARESRALVDRMRSEPIVVVAGGSGVGKSSLCRAGALPELVRVGVDGRKVTLASMTPGRDPMAGLASALVAALGDHAVADALAERPEEVARELRRAMGGETCLVLFIDQLEELHTASDPAEAIRFSSAVAHLVAGSAAVRVLASIRADFLAETAEVGELGGLLDRSLFLLRPMGSDGLREAVVGPARSKGARFESDAMVDELVAATERAASGLPLLQFTLAELWDKREERSGVIPASALADLGGVAACLARHADNVIAEMLPEARAAARHVLLRLVTPERTRDRRTADEIATDEASRSALDALVRGRLIAVDDGEAYELAHDALIGGWGALRGWLDDSVESQAARRRLESAAAEWDRLARPGELLWRARQLEEAEAFGWSELPARQEGFLRASRRAVRRRRWLRMAVVSVVPLAVALTWGGIRLSQVRERDREIAGLVDRAHGSFAAARSRMAEAERLRRAALDLWDARRGPVAEEQWAAAGAAARGIDRVLGDAAQALEHALLLDPERADVHRLLADLLYERALIAERDGQADRRDELLARLALHDDRGDRLARWRAPARLSLASAPRGAAVSLARYAATARGLRALSPARALGATPLTVELEPGSYRLEVAAPGFATLTLPVLVERGGELEESVRLLPASAIPPGFAYVPPGRFLVGSSDEILRREFLATVPLHAARTGGYLIALHETTYGEWIEFLESLPPAERARLAPKVSILGVHGVMGLQEDRQGGWRLRFQPTVETYEARLGEPIRYQGRDRRAVQDWRRFPVSGVSAEDAERYVGWLRSSGRVPRARLCTEHEWERAARGADDREFPSGDSLSPDDANFDETYGKDPRAFGPDEIGSHPLSVSPFGIHDMTGNVWEWTRATLSAEKYAVRGGGFYFGQMTGRATNRWLPEATARDFNLGLRVCADPP